MRALEIDALGHGPSMSHWLIICLAAQSLLRARAAGKPLHVIKFIHVQHLFQIQCNVTIFNKFCVI